MRTGPLQVASTVALSLACIRPVASSAADQKPLGGDGGENPLTDEFKVCRIT